MHASPQPGSRPPKEETLSFLAGTPIIATTGTKGKTTTTRLLDAFARVLGRDTVRADTDGWYVNGAERGTIDDSKRRWGLVPSVAPGRFLSELPASDGALAILEAAIGCSASAGLGYRWHRVGIWTNVYDDHITGERIRSREDIAAAKAFIVARIQPGGWCVFNADDPLVASTVASARPAWSISLLPVGETFAAFDLAAHRAAGGSAIRIDRARAVLLTPSGETELLRYDACPISFRGAFTPSRWNLAFAVAGLLAHADLDHALIPQLRAAAEAFRFDARSNRLNLLPAGDVQVLVDFAHEGESLRAVADLARAIGAPVLGVLRLAPDRTDEHIDRTAARMATAYDRVIVYDKVDGVHQDRYVSRTTMLVRHAGDTMRVFAARLRAHGTPVVEERPVELDALAHAIATAPSGATIVYIPAKEALLAEGFAAHVAALGAARRSG